MCSVFFCELIVSRTWALDQFIEFLADEISQSNLIGTGLPIDLCYLIISYLPLPKIITQSEVTIHEVNRSLITTFCQKMDDLEVTLVCVHCTLMPVDLNDLNTIVCLYMVLIIIINYCYLFLQFYRRHCVHVTNS